MALTQDSGPIPARPNGGRQRLILLLLLALVIVLSALLVRELIRASEALLAHTQAERELLIHLDRVEGLYGTVKDAESALRGTLLVGDRVFVESYRRAVPRAQELAAAMRRDGLMARPEGAELNNFLARVESRLAAMARVESSFDSDGPDAATELLRDQVSSESFGAILASKERIEEKLQDELESLGSAGQRALDILHLAVLGIGANLLLVLMLAALVARQNRQRSESQGAMAKLNQRLEAELDNSRNLLEGLVRLGRLGHLLQASQTVEEAEDAVQRAMPRLVKDIDGCLYFYNASRNYLESRVSWGHLERHSIPVMAPDACWALRQGRRHDSGGDSDAPHCGHLEGKGEASCACIPLDAQGRTLGILHLQGPAAAFARHAPLLDAVTEQLALTLSNIALRDTLRIESIRDPLTGLYNRRYLENSFDRELARARRHRQGLALLAFDIDHFKRFNDEYGHAAGDAVLEAFGDLLLSSVRKEDLPCRMGGEEFVLLLPEADLGLGMARAEQVRAALEALRLEHLGQPIGTVTLSAGVAAFPQHGDTLDGLLATADKALYRAKKLGRNRVEAGSPPGIAFATP
jgi:diguanylate cyclase (GGDEF)-like protein